MGRLGDVQPGRVHADCASCQRSGQYQIRRLIDRYEPDVSSVDWLRHLTTSCCYQRRPRAPPAQKYEHLCLAAITLPPPVKQIPPVPPGVPYTIEVWREVGATSSCTSPPSTRCRWRWLRSRSPAKNGRRTRSRSETGLGSCGSRSVRRGMFTVASRRQASRLKASRRRAPCHRDHFRRRWRISNGPAARSSGSVRPRGARP